MQTKSNTAHWSIMQHSGNFPMKIADTKKKHTIWEHESLEVHNKDTEYNNLYSWSMPLL